jgi:hypothetical protein
MPPLELETEITNHNGWISGSGVDAIEAVAATGSASMRGQNATRCGRSWLRSAFRKHYDRQ